MIKVGQKWKITEAGSAQRWPWIKEGEIFEVIDMVPRGDCRMCGKEHVIFVDYQLDILGSEFLVLIEEKR